jgi:hypothetical protein
VIIFVHANEPAGKPHKGIGWGNQEQSYLLLIK